MQKQLFSVGKLLGKPREKNVIRIDFIETRAENEKMLEPVHIMPSDGVWCVCSTGFSSPCYLTVDHLVNYLRISLIVEYIWRLATVFSTRRPGFRTRAVLVADKLAVEQVFSKTLVSLANYHYTDVPFSRLSSGAATKDPSAAAVPRNIVSPRPKI